MSVRDLIKTALDAAPPDLRRERVETKWGVIEVRAMSGSDFDLYLEWLSQHAPKVPDDETPEQKADRTRAAKRLRSAALVCVCSFDPDDGQRVFTPDQIPKLAERPFTDMADLWHAADEMNRDATPGKAATPTGTDAASNGDGSRAGSGSRPRSSVAS